jgi:hypothetical protein
MDYLRMDNSHSLSAKGQPLSIVRPESSIEELIASTFVEDLVAAAKHSSLNEDLALAILRRRELSSPVLEAIGRNASVIKYRKVLVGLVEHQHTPRHVSLPLIRRLFTFELMQVALAPAVPADVKRLAQEVLIGKLGTLSMGERITLARQASSAIAGALLLHTEPAVIEAALQNPRTTESSIVKALAKPGTSPVFLSMLIDHPKWFLRREIQIGILRRPEATEPQVMKVAARLPKRVLQELLTQFNLPASRKQLLQRALLQS